MRRLADEMIGKRFGHLVVLEYIGHRNKKDFYQCQCDCGNLAVVRGQALRSGATQSCGCMKRKKRPVKPKPVISQKERYRLDKLRKVKEFKERCSIPVDKSKFNDDWMFSPDHPNKAENKYLIDNAEC